MILTYLDHSWPICHHHHHWLVVGLNLPLWKIMEWFRQLGWFSIPNMMGKIIHCSKAPTRYILVFQWLTIINHRLTIHVPKHQPDQLDNDQSFQPIISQCHVSYTSLDYGSQDRVALSGNRVPLNSHQTVKNVKVFTTLKRRIFRYLMPKHHWCNVQEKNPTLAKRMGSDLSGAPINIANLRNAEQRHDLWPQYFNVSHIYRQISPYFMAQDPFTINIPSGKLT